MDLSGGWAQNKRNLGGGYGLESDAWLLVPALLGHIIHDMISLVLSPSINGGNKQYSPCKAVVKIK